MEKTMTTRRFLKYMVAAALISAAGCGQQAITTDSVQLADYQILANGQEEGGEFCKDFNLTPEQAEWFFARAKLMEAQQLYQRFDHLPCWVRGTARSSAGIWQWEIRAGGTARIVSPDGEAELLGCDQCDAVLSGVGQSVQ